MPEEKLPPEEFVQIHKEILEDHKSMEASEEQGLRKSYVGISQEDVEKRKEMEQIRIDKLKHALESEPQFNLENIKQEVIFAPIPDSRGFQRQLNKLTAQLEARTKEKDIAVPSKRQLRCEGRSTIDMNEGLFSYYLTNYEVARRYISEYSQLKGKEQRVKILEIGSGVGWGARYLSDSLEKDDVSLEIVATNRVVNDVDRQTLDYAREIYGKEKVLQFEEADATKLGEKFDKEEFDVVVMLETIEHLPRKIRDNCMKQISQILKGDGLLLISTPSLEGHGITESQAQDEGHVWVYGNRHDLEDLVSPYFSKTQINRLVNRQQIVAFGGLGIRARLRSLAHITGIKKPPASLYENYRYELGKAETDKIHQEAQDTYAWFVVGQR